MTLSARSKIGFTTAVSLVIANMVGTGVFTSLGFQVLSITNIFAIIMLWVVGGIISLCGALVYGEIGTRYPDSGGEYNYLSKIYHPSIGFLAGWVSATVGFSAPIAMAAMALGTYVNGVIPGINEKLLAVIVIMVITAIHSFNLKAGSLFQRVVTILKVAVIVFIILAGFFSSDHQLITLAPGDAGWSTVFSGAFAISLYWVTYSYSGWNAAAYMAGEIENPKRNLPRSLFLGTLVVTAMYVLLNFIFLYTTPIGEMAGKKEIGLIASTHIFGNTGGNIMGMVIAFLLVSAISAMVMAGPRVMEKMGKDVQLLNFLSITNKNGVPYISIFVQSIISIVLVLTAKFEFVLQFTSFSLNLFTFLTVLGIFVLSIRKDSQTSSRKLLLFFIPAIIFLVCQVWILFKGFEMKPNESALGMLNLAAGFVFWIIATLLYRKKNKTVENEKV